MANLTEEGRVRPGRECRECGEGRREMMAADRRSVDGHKRLCKQCHRQRTRRWYDANADRAREYRRRRYADNADRERAYAQQWRAANTDRERAYRRGYRAENTHQLREQARWYRAVNADRSVDEIAARRDTLRPDGLKRCRRCGLALPFGSFARDSARADGLNSTCRDCSHVPLLTVALTRMVELDLYTCIYCGSPCDAVDHVIPQTAEGPDEPANLVPACTSCNSSKNAADPYVWMSERFGPGWAGSLARHVQHR